jgi:hypothetical protein
VRHARVSAAQFKAECLKLMDQMEKTRQPPKALSCQESFTEIPQAAS